MEVSRLIAAHKPRKLNLDSNLDDIILLEYFTENMSEDFIMELKSKNYNVKQIICADYAQISVYNFDDLFHYCCKCLNHYPLGSTLQKEPCINHYLVESLYLNSLNFYQSRKLIDKVENFNDLKALLFLDELYLLSNKEINMDKSITENLSNIKWDYLDQEDCKLSELEQKQCVSFFSPAQNVKTSTRSCKLNLKKFLIGFGIITLATVSSVYALGSYFDWKKKDIQEFEINMKQYKMCYESFLRKDYQDAVQCSRKLEIKLDNISWFSRSNDVLLKLKQLNNDIESKLDSMYNGMYIEAENLFDKGVYYLAYMKLKKLESELKTVNYYTKRDNLIKKAESLDEKILKELGRKTNRLGDVKDGINSFKTVLNTAYKNVKCFFSNRFYDLNFFYRWLGFNKDSAETISWITLTLPFYLIIRRKIKKLKKKNKKN